MTTQAAFDKDEFKIFISKDESNWTPVEYTRSANAGWTLARVPFFIKGGVDNLYIRFVSSVEGAYRLDDVVLAEGAGDGENITFIEDIQHTEESLIFFDDFEWVPGKEGGNRDNFGGDDDGNMTTIMEGAPVKWTLDPSNCYKRMGMVKLGRTKIGGGMITPNLEDVGTGNRTLRLMFDVAVPFTSDYDDI